MTEQPEMTPRAAASDGDAARDVVKATMRDAVLGVELEAAEVRVVLARDGVVAALAGEAEAQALQGTRGAIASTGSLAGVSRGNVTSPLVVAKPSMYPPRPVNTKLVVRAPVAAPKASTAPASANAPGPVVAPPPAIPAAQRPRVLVPPDYAIAPAVILPRFAGEPLRADLAWPPQPRGTGEVWPPEARIEAGETTGRFPMAYAWHMLAAKQPWNWRVDGRETSITAAQAIAQVLAATATKAHPAARDGSRPDKTPATAVIPNHLSESARQELLDATAAHDINLSLLWRPVAAAMAWCERFAGEISADRLDPDRPAGAVLVLHFGLDFWEVTAVDVVAHRAGGGTHYIPARRRKVIEPLPSYGVELMHRLAIRSLEMSYQQMSPARVWELIWCTPWLKAALSLLGDGDVPFPSVVALAKHARSGEFLKQQARQATQRIFRAGEPIAGLLRQCLGKTPQFTDIRDWFAQRKSEAPPEGYLGAIITGPLANVPCERDQVGMHHLMKVWPNPKRVLVEGVTMPVGVLARGAAKHASFLRQIGRGAAATPTFLDTLPRVRIAATVAGQPAWVDLLEDAPALVPGGVALRRPQGLAGFPIKPDTTRFKIAIHHEDLPTVHIAAARLPQVFSQPEPVTLHATLRPGHGFPEVELVPIHEGLFGRHRVMVDMRSMKDTGLKPAEFLKTVG
jgi:hypothetical protein